MIEELTPQLLWATILLIVVVAPVLTLVLSGLLLGRYRVAVRRAMAATSGFEAAAEDDSAPVDVPVVGERRLPQDVDVVRLARRLPWRNALRYVLAGTAFALVFSAAAQQVFPSGLGLAGFAIGVWIYLWPAFLAVPLVVRLGLVKWLVGVGAYVGVMAGLGAWAAMIHNVPEYQFGTFSLPARSNVTPLTLLRLWLVVNGAPTLLMLLCLNRWVRAVAPMLLALVTTAIAGLFAVYFMLYSPRGVDAAVSLAVALEVRITWVLIVVLLLALLATGMAGWAVMRGIAAAYRKGRASDQSILLDALWLLFASSNGMWLALGGVAWIGTVPVAFLAFKLAWLAAGRLMPVPPFSPVGLTFLRVFALGRRSELLLQQLAGHWRHIGSIQLITGLDLAHSIVQPHQFLDFMSGRLKRHFVRDAASLARSMAECDRAADPDGRFRINNFFCHADSWQAVLPRLVAAGERVLMDLRSFSPANDGCVHELNYLVASVPFAQCLLLMDKHTDTAFLDRMLTGAVSASSVESPNFGKAVSALPRLAVDDTADPCEAIIARLGRV